MEKVNVYCVNTGQTYSVPLGMTFNEFAQSILGSELKINPVAVLLDNSLQDLQYRILTNGRVEFVDSDSQDGYSVIVRSLIFLL